MSSHPYHTHPSPRTPFLDLTDGAGGPEEEEEDPRPDNHWDGDEDEEDDEPDGTGTRASAPARSHPPRGNSSTTTTMTTTTTHIVETGQEHTGRWTKEEHDAFLEGLKLYGKEWKKVAARVKTRTVVQTRTHAQKYFQKLQRLQQPGTASNVTSMADVDATAAGMMADAEPTSPWMETSAAAPATGSALRPRKRSGRTGASPDMSAATAPSPSQWTEGSTPLPPLPRTSRRSSSAATFSAAQVISTLSSSPALSDSYMPPPSKHGFLPTHTSVASSSNAQTSSTTADTAKSLPPLQAPSSWQPHRSLTTTSGGTGISIVAPDPTLALQSSFPEPSPAATGKRKLAEIAAARMLAGVISNVDVHAAERPESMGDVDEEGRETPPPGQQALGEAPRPPFGTSPTLSGSGVKGQPLFKGLSLQIVNPSHLMSDMDVPKRRRGVGGESPQTPWDGQLDALLANKTDATDRNSRNGLPHVHSDAEGHAGNPTLGIPLAVDLEAAAEVVGHPVCVASPDIVRSELHNAILRLDLNALESEAQNTIFLNQPDSAGYYPLQTASALGMLSSDHYEVASQMVSLLLKAGADPNKTDAQGNNSLHWAARAGDKTVATHLVMRNCNFEAKNRDGESPLHWSLRAGRAGIDVATVLLTNGARPAVLSRTFRRPVDVAADGFLDDPNSLASLRLKEANGKKVGKNDLKKAFKSTAVDRRDARANLFLRSLQSKTLVLHHPECLEHHPKTASDWEAPDRIKSIMRRILPSSDSTGETETSGVFPYEITASTDFERARLDFLSRIHSAEYLAFVNQLSKDLERQLKEAAGTSEENEKTGSPPVVPFTPHIQRSMIKVSDSQVKLSVNSDTSFSVGSLRAARRAAGAVQHAVDCVLVGRNRNSFCVVRPPGHHAGINGLLEGGESCGFCIFNNVAAGALYAISEDRLLCKRCAIVDIDVHHGNGTEEIVRRCRDPGKLFFFSIHLYDNDKKKRSGDPQYKFYPGTGSEDDLALNIINVPLMPLWKSPSSAPPVVRHHNTRGKVRSSQDSNDDTSETETPHNSGSRLSDGGSESGSAQAAAQSSRSIAAAGLSGRMAYREAIRSRLLPALRAFDPDLILISAGFDAAKGDVGNARHEKNGERLGIDLEPEDYAWTTRKILEIADICCQGRVVSVLEGGYGRTSNVQGAMSGLDRTMFSECAIRHLHAMIDPYDTERRFT